MHDVIAQEWVPRMIGKPIDWTCFWSYIQQFCLFPAIAKNSVLARKGSPAIIKDERDCGSWFWAFNSLWLQLSSHRWLAPFSGKRLSRLYLKKVQVAEIPHNNGHPFLVVIPVPLQFLPSLSRMRPPEQAHTLPDCVSKQSWLHPPLLLLHWSVTVIGYSKDHS